jgi:DNA adenine methylase
LKWKKKIGGRELNLELNEVNEIKNHTKEKYKSPINWYGGKYYMANDIIEIFPEHNMYVEGFGGAGHVLFKKKTSPIEVYNDIHSGLYNLFKLLRDDSQRDKLIRQITLTPYSREEFMSCKKTWKTETNVIEKVRKFYTAIMQSVGGTGSGGWCYAKSKSRRGMSQAVSRWLGNVDENMVDLIERLREVQIENLDIIELINKYDKEDTLFYLDPPYIQDTRSAKKVYDYEMSIEKHKELVDKLLEIKGKVVLSGYDHEVYKTLENKGWHKVLLGEYSKRSQRDNNGELDKGQEFVWINFIKK